MNHFLACMTLIAVVRRLIGKDNQMMSDINAHINQLLDYQQVWI